MVLDLKRGREKKRKGGTKVKRKGRKGEEKKDPREKMKIKQFCLL